MTGASARWFLAGVVVWSVVSVVVLSFLGAFSLETYAVTWVAGALVLLEHATPRFLRTSWDTHARLLLYSAMLVVATYVVVQNLAFVLPGGG